MMKDLKNVLITFGLIGLVFAQGSSLYQNKIKKENAALVASQEKLIKIEQNKLAQITAQQEALKKQQELVATSAQDDSNQALYNQQQIDLANKQAALLVKEQAAAKALASQKAKALANQKALTKAKAQAQIVATTPSRRSSAS